MKTRVILDFETKSEVDLLLCGKKRYARGREADILMAGYRYDLPEHKTELWTPGMRVPDFFINPENYEIHAHNAEFEWEIWNTVGLRYGFKKVGFDTFHCTAALASRYGIPRRLEQAGTAMKLKHQKNPEGKQLIQLFCCPEQNYGRDATGMIQPRFAQHWERFKQYCIDDVEAEYELLKSLPSDYLSERERDIWLMSCEMNNRGLPVDVEACKQIRRVSETYRLAHFDLLPEMTNGKITKITQTKRIKDYVNDKGFFMPDCTSETVQDMLMRDDLPNDVLAILDMRAQIGLSSIGKYIRFHNMNVDGWVYDSQIYYGAHTGRWTGAGVQFLNLPRAKVSDPEAEIQKFFDGSIVDENPVKSARALIRPMLKAPDGYTFLISDYSSIEYVISEWYAGNVDALDRFIEGFDVYKDEAASMYGVPYDDVDDDQRRSGKVTILGCGYGQGARKLVETAKTQWGMVISLETSEFWVNAYRAKHKQLVSMWYRCKDMMIAAIQNPGQTFTTHRVSFRVVKDRVGGKWLQMTLASGRAMYYKDPFVENGIYGLAPGCYGMVQKTKQWMRKQFTPGLIVENIVQATARDILTYGMLQIEKEMGPILRLTIYDEIVAIVPEDGAEEKLKQMESLMCSTEEWAKTIPLRAEGCVSKRYKKM